MNIILFTFMSGCICILSGTFYIYCPTVYMNNEQNKSFLKNPINAVLYTVTTLNIITSILNLRFLHFIAAKQADAL